jgi:ATP-binding cassette subfamily B (MDR/TAP) protein 1
VNVFVSIAGFSYTGQRLTQKIREAYLRAVLRQNIAFFDNVGSGEVTTRITADMNLIQVFSCHSEILASSVNRCLNCFAQDGLSQKVGLTLTGVATFFAALIVGFVRCWRLTLVLLSVTVAIILVMGGLGSSMKKFQAQALDASAVGGTWAEEAISSIRTATAFGTQDKLAAQYDVQLNKASKLDFKGKIALAFLIALMMGILNLQYGLAFWQGSRFLKNGDVTVSQILTVIFASMLAGVSLGQIAPHAGAFGMAVAAAKKVFHTIERKSPVNPELKSGETPTFVDGEIIFKGIRHVYPSRPEQTILEDFNLTIPSGKITAIVGASGSGKSTVVGLIERFYVPINGDLFIDGYNFQDLNLRWLRRQISLVSQEPVLFSTTIYSNIEFGLIGTEYEGVSKLSIFVILETPHLSRFYRLISCPGKSRSQDQTHRGCGQNGQRS